MLWALDASAHDGTVGHHVSVEGVDVSGAPRDELAARVAGLANRFEATPVIITAGSHTYHSTEGDLGLSIDQARAVDEALAAHRGSLLTSFPRWFGSLIGTTTVRVAVTVDEGRLEAEVARLSSGPAGSALEPSLTLRDGQIVVRAGGPGSAVAPATVRPLLESRGFTLDPVAITVPEQVRAPATSTEQAQSAADAANALTGQSIDVSAGPATTTLTPAQLRRWVVADGQGPSFGFSLDPDLVVADLSLLLRAGTSGPVDASITLDPHGHPTITPSVDGAACCAPGAGDVLLAALHARPTGPVALAMRPVAPGLSTAAAQALGINEVVSSFTTHHPCCAPRVSNIHRAADLVRGVILRPGQSLSFNDFLGQRTADKGWVDAPSIIDGKLEDSIGGGISQFMTTMFNAAWFAGLDFDTYQSHSLYITRYPFGREATISWTAPDLKIRDSTPYGVMIWPTYTDTSITITLYSTRLLAKVEQGPQTATLSGKSCSSITTPRIRTYLDGTVKNDVFYARYQAKEGVLCNDPLPAGVSPVAVPGQPPPSVPPSATPPSTATSPSTTRPGTTPPPTTAPKK